LSISVDGFIMLGVDVSEAICVSCDASRPIMGTYQGGSALENFIGGYLFLRI
jgi:hypothetical protein